jgi:hypothetical protein
MTRAATRGHMCLGASPRLYAASASRGSQVSLGGGRLGKIAMPFSKHHVEPARMEAMRAAFNKVCATLLLKWEVDDPMTEIMTR